MAGGSLTASGSQPLTNGLIIKWGSEAVSVTTGGTETVTFGVAFPNACLSVNATRVEPSGASSYGISVASVSASSFDYWSNGARAGGFYWIAVGY